MEILEGEKIKFVRLFMGLNPRTDQHPKIRNVKYENIFFYWVRPSTCHDIKTLSKNVLVVQ